MQIEDIFEQYHALADQVDKLFAQVRHDFPSEVKCGPACSDCCNAVFDLSLVEAMALNSAFQAKFSFGAERSAILEAAEKADRQAARHKRDFYQKAKQGATDGEILSLAAQVRIRCPLLGQDEQCLLYEARPLTCRLYGAPVSVEGKSHVCGLCAFEPGKAYPAIAMDRIQDKLAQMSRDLVSTLESRYSGLSGVYVPVSMALLTKYDEKYLGTDQEREQA